MAEEKPESGIPVFVDLINILIAISFLSFVFSDFNPDDVNPILWILGCISVMRAGFFLVTSFK